MDAADIKREVLRLLREDEEFRYAVAGAIGILEVLKRLDFVESKIGEHSRILAEHTKRIEELGKRIEEHSRVLAEHSRRIEELSRRVEEHTRMLGEHSRRIEELGKRVEELGRRIEEHSRVLAEHSRILGEHSKRIEELSRRIEEHTRILERLTTAVSAIGVRYGVSTEESFRLSIKYLVEDLLKLYRVSRWVYYDSEGLVYGYPSVVEADLLIRDEEHVLVEYKAYVGRADVGEIVRLGQLYERVSGVKPRLLLVSAAADRRALELAENLGVKVVTGSVS